MPEKKNTRPVMLTKLSMWDTRQHLLDLDNCHVNNSLTTKEWSSTYDALEARFKKTFGGD